MHSHGTYLTPLFVSVLFCSDRLKQTKKRSRVYRPNSSSDLISLAFSWHHISVDSKQNEITPIRADLQSSYMLDNVFCKK